MDEKIQKLEITMTRLTTDLDYIKKSQDKNEDQHREILVKIEQSTSKIDDFIQSSSNHFVDKKYYQAVMDKMSMDHLSNCNKVDETVNALDSKYSPMIAWQVMVWAARIIGGSLLLGFIGLIAKLNKMF